MTAMPIPPEEAADVAKAHGLTLADARALSAMADDKDHAANLAARFQPEADEAAEARKIADRVDRPGF
jgi:hypothetical protein